MYNNSEKFHIRSKVWIEDDEGNVVFGLGRFKILETIRQSGSIQAAAKELKMSYRAVWGKVRATEERLGEPLLIRNIGGSSGGGSRLTPFAQMLMDQFSQLHKRVNTHSDELFEKNFARGLRNPQTLSQKKK
ncbi:winged helix-turn-helix domain-containing protein [Desulfonema magnum]|uniref:Transcription regulator HTH motif-containing protein n=1 Tax=Desulfonema magnum TaxID=45655 RepID=A0A975BF51_9BACT|nr:LysR family transcriptional regulator [Desulfonema magnum]QTA84155.1 Transcription regulator HTH motif-containing protein [Desulfonema magnum]